MKKTYKILNLDCGHCALKLQDKLNKIEGVNVEIFFMNEKIIIDIADGLDESEKLQEIKATVKKFDPYCKIMGV